MRGLSESHLIREFALYVRMKPHKGSNHFIYVSRSLIYVITVSYVAWLQSELRRQVGIVPAQSGRPNSAGGGVECSVLSGAEGVGSSPA